MKQVTVYLVTNLKSPKMLKGKGCYVIEFITEKGPVTRTETIDIEGTAMQAEMLVLIKALRRLKEQVELTIYQSGVIQRAIDERWISKWQQNGWTTSRGKAVSYQSEWQEMAEMLKVNVISCKTGTHSYLKWMESEVNKEKE